MQAQLCAGIWLAMLLSPALAGRHLDLSLHMLSSAPCQDRNLRLSASIQAAKLESGQTLLPHVARTLDNFILELKEALDSHPLTMRPIEYVFSEAAPFNPTCDGIWAEFGVASGSTINLAAKFRKAKCHPSCPSVHGFDNFTGLPEDWVLTGAATIQKNMSNQGGKQGKLPTVEPNVNLVKGPFNESIPEFLRNMKVYAGGSTAISFLHVGCDLYADTKDVFQMLGHRLVVGSVVVFDKLINYESFKQHEVKALWEWLQATGVKLLPIGVLGPIANSNESFQLDWTAEPIRASDQHQQSAAFVIADIPLNPPTNDNNLT